MLRQGKIVGLLL
ncbi:hypothetical protein VTH82DRAFT_5439 [Thermothelomyces myriococcoides]